MKTVIPDDVVDSLYGMWHNLSRDSARVSRSVPSASCSDSDNACFQDYDALQLARVVLDSRTTNEPSLRCTLGRRLDAILDATTYWVQYKDLTEWGYTSKGLHFNIQLEGIAHNCQVFVSDLLARLALLPSDEELLLMPHSPTHWTSLVGEHFERIFRTEILAQPGLRIEAVGLILIYKLFTDVRTSGATGERMGSESVQVSVAGQSRMDHI